MRIAFAWSSIDVRSWRSKDELLAFMGQFADSMLIGESDEQENEFYSATVSKEFGQPTKPLAVGLCSEGHGVTPQLLTLPVQRLCLFGVNSEIVAVNAETRQIEYRVNLGFLFRAMVPLPDVGLVLALHETGATAFRENGLEVWSFSRDVLEDVRVDGSSIRFQLMDSEPVTLDIGTGKELAASRP